MEAEVQGYLTELGILKEQIRDAIHGLDNEAANWRPLPKDTNSIYAILYHLVGSARVPFPGRLNLNSRWIPKGRELIKTKNYDPNTDVSEIQALVKGTPDVKGRIGGAIKTDWYYFKRMKVCIGEQLAKCA